jgi:acylphosphatase
VGYRYFAQVAARKHDIVGYVRNLINRNVEVFAQGIGADLDAFAGRLAEGTPHSVVEKVERIAAVVRPDLDEFRIIGP